MALLEELFVKNLGVIREARIRFERGLHVLTGETGAGKTFIVEALGLAAGMRADPDVVGPAGPEALVEASFDFDGTPSELDVESEWLEAGGSEGLVVVTRVVSREGRSRAYVNGRPVSVGQVRTLVGKLLSIHGQSSQIALQTPRHQLGILDAAGGVPALENYRRAFEALSDAHRRLEALGGDPRERAREIDLTLHQLKEIGGAELVEGEDESLDAELVRLESVAELKLASAEAREAAIRAADELGGADVAEAATGADDELELLMQRCRLLAEEARDLASEFRRYSDTLDEDPARLEEVRFRTGLLFELKRKYGPTLADVIAYGEAAARRFAELKEFDLRGAQAEEAHREALRAAIDFARELSAVRVVIASEMTEQVQSHLEALGLEGSRFRVVLESPEEPEESDLTISGVDSVTFEFSANEGVEARPVSKVASGGELSRLMLAVELASMASAKRYPTTLVFDEVDSGVGGVAAIAVGEKLSELSDAHQVICVTHLAQVASRAERHYLVTKAGAAASVSEVAGHERRDEISRMLAGEAGSTHAREHALELIELAESSRLKRRRDGRSDINATGEEGSKGAEVDRASIGSRG